MTKFGITYKGYEKDTWGYSVKFQVKNTTYVYEVPFYWMEKIDQIARHSEPKALNMAKKVGDLVDAREVDNGYTEEKRNDARAEVEKRPEDTSQHPTSSVRPVNRDEHGSNMAKQDAASTILKARNLVQRIKSKSVSSGD